MKKFLERIESINFLSCIRKTKAFAVLAIAKFSNRGKYFWHQVRLKELSAIASGCVDERFKHKLKKKISYHEKASLSYITEK
ncbi:hypothetical protein ACFO3D_05930 [Virgibacillus kekensis]|uniref:Uncharacterized protein n=1 Tax=Virgibacillus kekensis TaxID=202261 RepID=A0ABV9DG28_9BACI